MNFVGHSDNNCLFGLDSYGVVIDKSTKEVVSVDSYDSLVASADWSTSTFTPEDSLFELASASIADLDIKVFSNNDRMYTIPKSVQNEAKRSLEWRKEHKRGGTPVGLNTARTLAAGGQIGIKKIRHIAKYFPRHEVDKKGKGYKPGEDGFPSNGRIAWALWGGDAARRWASAIVERENKKIADASIYEEVSLVNLSDFSNEDSQFSIRVNADGSGIDRLYMTNFTGLVSVWDDGSWSDLGESSESFAFYDAVLDQDDSTIEKLYFPVDQEAALVASALLDSSPFLATSIENINVEEASMVAAAMGEIDWGHIDSLTFADAPAKKPEGDGKYTPEERAKNAGAQVRDATGRFAKMNSRVTISKNPQASGEITGVNADNQTVTVKLDNGSSVDVPANLTEAVSDTPEQPNYGTAIRGNRFGQPLDVSGILGEPRDSSNPVLAGLPNRLPPLTQNDIQSMLTDWPNWVADQRTAFDKTKQSTPQVRVNTDAQDVKAPNAYNDPYLRKWLDEKYSKKGKTSYPNRSWYNPVRRDDIEKKKKASDVSFSSDSIVAAATQALTPETSDVPPIYMAIVAEDDPQAVMDLVSLVPSSKESTQPTTFSRKNGKWVNDEAVLADLNSATPPPVVVLDDASLKSVLEQIEGPPEQAVTASLDSVLSLLWDSSGQLLAVTAAGGLDKNKGNAEKLRRYWTVGEGGAKIRWGTGGDWTRCVRNLSKYMGPRAKGYCALRHKEMTGLWTGDKAHRQLYGKKGAFSSYSDEFVRSTQEVISNAELNAQANEARQRIVASGGPQAPGAEFYMPLVLPEGVETGDGRKFAKGAISMRELPLPLMWQIKTAQGHDGSVVVGKITKMDRTDGGIGNAYGVFDTGEYGKEAERLVRGGFINGISADLDRFEADEEEASADEEKKIGSGKIKITKGRVMGVTLVPKPAFQECKIILVENMKTSQEEQVLPDGEYIEEPAEQDSAALVACAAVVASIPVTPPTAWFENPKLDGPTPLTVSDDGRVFGHIAAWHVDHIGMAFGTKPPRSKSQYSYFHTGIIRTEEGKDLPVGQLTLAGGHASLEASARSAAKHYDDTASAFADVHAGEDSHGIWVAGALRPSITPEQVRSIRASAPSGDWRPINGALELVAVCQVNVPGFPIARARVASGSVMALVAAGARVLAQMKSDPVAELSARLDRLESADKEMLLSAVEEVKYRFSTIKGDLIVSEEPMTADAGLDIAKPMTIQVMEQLLADSVSFYHRAQGFHWNVKGPDFTEYHGLFGEIYSNVQDAIDPIAENILKLGSDSPFNMSDLMALATLGDSECDSNNAMAMTYDLMEANEVLIEELKMAFNVLEAANEQAVANFIAERLNVHQKWAWQLKSSLVPEGMEKSENESEEDFFVTVFSTLEEQGLVAAGPSQAVREELAKTGEALPDGSYPIRNVADLKKAIKAYGRSNPEDRAKVRRHIKKRARSLKQADLIPEEWKSLSAEGLELSATVDDFRSRIAARSLTAAGEILPEDLIQEAPIAAEGPGGVDPKAPTPNGASDAKGIYTAKTQPRDAQGKFRLVLARLKQDLGDASLDAVAEKIAEAENLDNTGNYAESAKAAKEVIGIVDRLDTGALDKKSLENVRSGVTALSKAISNLPLPFQDQSQKIRFSDVPPALADLIKDMMKKVEDKIGKEEAKASNEKLASFISGSDVFSQGEISSEMNKLLRLLT